MAFFCRNNEISTGELHQRLLALERSLAGISVLLQNLQVFRYVVDVITESKNPKLSDDLMKGMEAALGDLMVKQTPVNGSINLAEKPEE